MITLLKDKTGCQITVGQNGYVWIKGTPQGEFKAEAAINLIAARAHESGLTNKIGTFLGGEQ